MPAYCDLDRLQELAGEPNAHFELNKALLSVVNTLDVTLAEAERVIREGVKELNPADFVKRGEGYPPPPCDVYRLNKQHYFVQALRFDWVCWYVKIGLDPGPPERLWVQSFHD